MRPLSCTETNFPQVQTVRTHGSGPCDRGSRPWREAIDNLGRRTAPLVIFAPRTGHRSAARRRLEPEMPNEQSEQPSQEPIQNPGGGAARGRRHRLEGHGPQVGAPGEVELGKGYGLRRAPRAVEERAPEGAGEGQEGRGRARRAQGKGRARRDPREGGEGVRRPRRADIRRRRGRDGGERQGPRRLGQAVERAAHEQAREVLRGRRRRQGRREARLPGSCSAPESSKSTSNADWSGKWPQ